MTVDSCDVVVVGGGSAGCVVASRLVAAGARVLVLEAGPDVPPAQVPYDIADLYPRSYYNPDYSWPDLLASQRVGDAAPTPFIQARVLGGGSSIMGMVALQGVTADYEEWSRRVPHWTPAEVAIAFDRVRRAVEIRTVDRDQWPPLVAAFGSACEAFGHPYLADLNATDADGFGPIPLSRTASARVSSDTAFLGTEVRSDPRIDVRCGVTVRSLVFDGSRCAGVRAVQDGREFVVRADRVILSAGAIHTPLLLQRSGVGDADLLRSLGVEVVAHVPGVGENLQNHPVVYLAAHVPRSSRQLPTLRQGFVAALRLSTGIAGGTSDVSMAVMNKSSWHGLGEAVGGVGISLMAPESRGTVRATGAGGHGSPDVRFNFLGNPVDRARLQHGFDLAAQLLASEEVRAHRNEVFAAGYTRVVRALNVPSRRNTVVTRVLSAMLDGPAPARRAMLRVGMSTGPLDENRLHRRSWRDAVVTDGTFGTYHVAGTCQMGRPESTEAVVDHKGDVHGVDGLTVIDASVMPTVPRANTNLPVQMLACRMADMQVGAA